MRKSPDIYARAKKPLTAAPHSQSKKERVTRNTGNNVMTTPKQTRRSSPRVKSSSGKKQSSEKKKSPRGLGVYERSMKTLAAKEEKVKQLKKSLNQEFTYTPETNRSRASSASGDSVFDRLYRNSHTKKTPRKNNKSNGERTKTPSSAGSNKSGTSKGTLEKLYQDGVRQGRKKPLTDKEEEKVRQRRLESRELAECTFKPRMDWRKKKAKPPPVKPTKKTSPEETKETTFERSIETSNASLDDGAPPPPVPVVHTVSDTRNYIPDSIHVSPLRDPETRSLAGSVAASSIADTEYGSI